MADRLRSLRPNWTRKNVQAEEPTLLELITAADVDVWIASFNDAGAFGERDPYEKPSRKMIVKRRSEELNELVNARPNTREAFIAAEELDRRRSWQSPAVKVAVAGLIVAAAALAMDVL